MRALKLLILVLLLASTATPAFARNKPHEGRCLCLPPSFETRWHDADAVFSGIVNSIDVVQERVERSNNDLPVTVNITVDKGYKGVGDHVGFILNSNMSVQTCMGFDYKVGQKYLFYVYMRRPESAEAWSLYDYPSGTFDVGGTCGGTKLLDSADTVKELAQIDEKREDMPESAKITLKPVHGFIGVPTQRSIAETPFEERGNKLESGVSGSK